MVETQTWPWSLALECKHPRQDGCLPLSLLYPPESCLVNRKRSVPVRSVMSDSLRPYGLQPTRLLCPWNSPGKNTGMGCHPLLQGIFPIQGSNPHLLHLLHWQGDSLPPAPLGKPKVLSKYLLNKWMDELNPIFFGPCSIKIREAGQWVFAFHLISFSILHFSAVSYST